MKAALLLSGGMDSCSLAWWKRPDLAITIDYGQKAAAAEIHAAGQVAGELSIPHEVIRVDCSSLGSGDMAHAAPDSHAKTSEWWPYRNQLLLTLASMRAISRGVEQLLIGTLKADGENHLDGTKTFVELVDGLMRFQEGGLRVVAPAIEMSAVELIRLSGIPPSILAWSHSCHKANIACGHCRGCNKYLETYAALGPGYRGGS